MSNYFLKGALLLGSVAIVGEVGAQCPTAGNIDAGTYDITNTDGPGMDGTCSTVVLSGNLFSTADITIRNGATLTIETDAFFIVYGGSILVESGGTLVVNYTGGGNGGLSIDNAGDLTIDAGGLANISDDLEVGDYVGGNGRTGTITVNGTITVADDYNMNENATLDGNGSITIAGDYTEDVSADSDAFTGSSSCNTGCETLPVELVNFEATRSATNLIKLQWTTSSEINNMGFHIEKSLNGRECRGKWNY